MNQACSLIKNKLILIVLILIYTSCQSVNKKQNNAIDNFTYLEMGIDEIQEGYNNNSFTIEELTEAYIERINKIDRNGPGLNAIIQINPDAITIAKQLDDEMQQGKTRGPLHGIPVLLKDNIDTRDKMATTAGSLALKNSYPLQDSDIAKKLRAAGAIIIGKANLSEWANFRGQLSTSGWSALGGLTKNPYVLDRSPCGSSSGSAVAVSANLTMLAIGTETNGSIVCPSHSNGIVGIKPTVGLVSRTGVIPISVTQDSPGPMSRTVKDAAICLGALVGVDSLDEKSINSMGKFYSDYTQFLKEDGLKNKRIGIYTVPLGNNFKVDSLFYEAVEYIKSHGAEVINVSGIMDGSVYNYSFDIMLYEYKDGLNKYFKSLGPEAPIKSVEELIAFNKQDSTELRYFDQKYLEMAQEKGSIKSDDYLEMLAKMLQGVREDGIDRVMDELKLDAIIAPTGSPAWKTDLINGDSYQLGSSSPAAISGYPNITVPMGYIGELPVGISFFGRAWSEPILLEIAYAYEIGTKHRKAPKFLITD